MALVPVRCLYCQSEHVIKGGKTDTSNQRYRWHNSACSRQSFLLDSTSQGRSLQIKQQVIELSLNGSPVASRPTLRTLGAPTNGRSPLTSTPLASQHATHRA